MAKTEEERIDAAREEIDEPVEVIPYNPLWPALYEQEKKALLHACGGLILGIEHFGSTAVPGLDAKPVIDILVGVTDIARSDDVITQCEKLGYLWLGRDTIKDRRYLRKRGAVHFNLAVVNFQGAGWNANLLLRDYLRRHPDAMRAYAARKYRILEQVPGMLLAYSDAKAALMQEMQIQARQWNKGRA